MWKGITSFIIHTFKVFIMCKLCEKRASRPLQLELQATVWAAGWGRWEPNWTALSEECEITWKPPANIKVWMKINTDLTPLLPATWKFHVQAKHLSSYWHFFQGTTDIPEKASQSALNIVLSRLSYYPRADAVDHRSHLDLTQLNMLSLWEPLSSHVFFSLYIQAGVRKDIYSDFGEVLISLMAHDNSVY